MYDWIFYYTLDGALALCFFCPLRSLTNKPGNFITRIRISWLMLYLLPLMDVSDNVSRKSAC